MSQLDQLMQHEQRITKLEMQLELALGRIAFLESDYKQRQTDKEQERRKEMRTLQEANRVDVDLPLATRGK